MKNIGLMGGTFNPFHLGHLETALELKTRCNLDEIILIPSNKPPHKPDDDIVSPIHRYAMTVLGTNKFADLIVSPIEIFLEGVSYSYRTINYFKENLGESANIFFITGVESFEKITTWKKWESVIDEVDFIVNSREGYPLRELFFHLPDKLAERCVLLKEEDFCSDLTSKEVKKAFIIETKPINISGSMVRERLSKGDDVQEFLPEQVSTYIKKENLYDVEV